MIVGLTSRRFWATVSMLSAKATVEPLYRNENIVIRSKTWDNGRKERIVSPQWKSVTASSARVLLKKLSWLSITPLGTPVVPLV